MKRSESKLKEENENIKELFNFNGDEKTLKHIKEMITNSKNSPFYFINLLEIFSKSRPHQHNVCKELVNSIYSCFTERSNKIQQNINDLVDLLNSYSFSISPQQFMPKELMDCVSSSFTEKTKEIKQYIKKSTDILKFIIFPEEFPLKEDKQQKEMFLLLEKDDINEFITFHTKNPTNDITKEQELNSIEYYSSLFERKWENDSISLLDFCCFYGSLKCFMYLLLNKCKITENT